MDPAVTMSVEDSIHIEATPEALYAMVADVTRMGEWSPICTGCVWEDGATGAVGDWFVGANELPGRQWETRCEIVSAEPGREFAWLVMGFLVRWTYRFEPEGSGTRVTESWDLTPEGVAWFSDRYGADKLVESVELRADLARTGIPQTLAAIKAAAESAD